MKNFILIASVLFCMVTFQNMLSAQLATSTRWAILAPPELGDLLTVELSKQQGIELVERADIDKVMREISLAALSETQGVGRRIELGKTLAADRLLVLYHPGNTNVGLRFEIIDTSTASILFHGQFDQYEGVTDEIIDALSDIVTTNIRDFRDGIRAIIAVPYFLSRGIDSQAEEYQKSFPRILGSSLMQQPGIAVISFEEYEAIRRELDFSGKQLERTVPILVRGEFLAKRQNTSLTNTESAGSYLFDLNLQIGDRSGVQKQIAKQSLTEQQVAECLAVEVTGQVFSILKDENYKPLSLEDQKKAFAETADKFRAYGMYSLARSHRESILLIDPMDVHARCGVLEEMWTVNRKFRVSPEAKEAFRHVDFLIRNKQVTFWQGYILCSMMLYENRLHEYDWQRNEILVNLPPGDFVYYDSHLGIMHFAPMIYKLPVKIENRDPGESLILNATGGMTEELTKEEWLRIIIPQHFYPFLFHCEIPGHAESLIDDFLKFLLETPECYYLPYINNAFRLYQGSGGNWCLDLKNRDTKKWQNFKDQLLKNGRDDLAFLAKFFEVCETIDHDRVASEKTLQAIQNAIDFAEERKLYAKVPWMESKLVEFKIGYEEQLARRAREKGTYEETKANSVRSDYLFKMPFPLPVEETFHLDMNMSVELVPDWREAFQYPPQFPTKSARSKQSNSERNDSNILVPEPHNSKADLAWNHWSIFFWRDVAGEVEPKQFYRFEIPEKYKKYKSEWDIVVENYQSGNGIIRVRSDGKNIWAATTEGILCFDGTGKIIGQFDTTTGLPEYVTPHRMLGDKHISTVDGYGHERDGFLDETLFTTRFRQYKIEANGSPIQEYVVLSVFPIGNGEAIAFGRSGANLKTWIAKLSFDSAKRPQVKVLHQAARDLNRNEMDNPELRNDPKNSDVVFTIPWITEMKDPLFPKRRQILVGRAFDGVDWDRDDGLSPLLIDLDTDEVMLLPQRYPDLSGLAGFENVKCVNGHLVGTSHRVVYSFDRNEDNLFVKTNLGLWDPSFTNSADFQPQRGWLIVDGNQVYSPGLAWYRLDFSAPQGKPNIEKLADEIVPYERFFGWYTKTASYGICGVYFCNPFNACCAKCGQLYKFDLTKPTNRDYTHSERFVIDYWLDTHDEAAKHLKEKGALVAGSISNWLKRHEPNSHYGMLQGDRHTIVVLDKSWKGTAADLEKIADLYRPWSIYFYDLKLSDNDVRVLATLLKKLRTRRFYFVNAGISKEQLKLLDASYIETLGLYYDDQDKKPTDDWISILFEPAKHGVKTDAFYGDLRFSEGLFSPDTTQFLEGRRN